jgi:hypothetical protein
MYDDDELTRRKIVRLAIALTRHTEFAPSDFELELLGKYVHGLLPIDDVVLLLEAEARGLTRSKHS